MAMLISEVARKHNECWAGHTYQGVTTGYDIIDGDYQGWSPGELCVIGGRPGMGKTAFILSIIHHLVTQRIPIALFTHEDLGNPVFFKRVLRAITDKKPLKEMTVQELINQEDLADIQLHIQSKTQQTMDYIRTEARRLVMDEGVKRIFIEDLQTLFTSETFGVTEGYNDKICYSLRELARELQVPIIVTSELNRGPENREGVEGKMPCLADLRASSAIESAADSVWLLHRPDYYHIYYDDNGYCLREHFYVLIKKNSYGPTGEFRLIYRKDRILSESYDPIPEPYSPIGQSSDAPF